MNVVDQRGHKLNAGLVVERVIGSTRGGIRGVVTHAGRQVDVTWQSVHGPSSRIYGTERLGLFGRTRRCNYLVVVPYLHRTGG
jgi:hypothetical protein